MARGPVQASVILPALNAAAHIEEQLLALAGQRAEVSWELIVADNGSTDETLAIVERVSPQIPARVRVVDASARRGASAARNAGAAAADGELLLFVDADDIVEELWLAEMTRMLREHPFVGGRIETLRLNGERLATWRINFFDQGLPTISGRPWVSGANFGCTAAAYATVGGCDEALAVGEDWDLSLRMYARGMPAVFAPRAVVHYRFRSKPSAAIRQVWAYGRSNKVLYERHGAEPPTILDALIRIYRDAKRVARDLLLFRRPMVATLDFAFVIGEATAVCRLPEFWRPVTRIVEVQSPVRLQRDRLRRLRRALARALRALPGRP